MAISKYVKSYTTPKGETIHETKYKGLSSDTKPDAANGDEFFEIDTGKTFYYDADGEQWIDPTASPEP